MEQEDETLSKQLVELLQNQKRQRDDLKITFDTIKTLRSSLGKRHCRRLYELLDSWVEEFHQGRVKQLYDEIQSELEGLSEHDESYTTTLSSEGNPYGISLEGSGAFYLGLLDQVLKPDAKMSKVLSWIYDTRRRKENNPFVEND